MTALRSSTFILSLILSVFVSFFMVTPSHALEAIPPSINVAGKPLVLNGVGSRTKFIITVYHAGLYLQKKSKDAKSIVAANQPMAVRLKIISGFANSKKVTHGINTGFKNSTGGKTAPIQPQINQFLSVFKAPIKKGDVFEFAYAPSVGTKVSKNGKGITVIKGLPFKQALFGIWLSNHPAQASLKKQMLGG